jgi:hypothetical protein
VLLVATAYEDEGKHDISKMEKEDIEEWRKLEWRMEWRTLSSTQEED